MWQAAQHVISGCIRTCQTAGHCIFIPLLHPTHFASYFKIHTTEAAQDSQSQQATEAAQDSQSWQATEAAQDSQSRQATEAAQGSQSWQATEAAQDSQSWQGGDHGVPVAVVMVAVALGLGDVEYLVL